MPAVPVAVICQFLERPRKLGVDVLEPVPVVPVVPVWPWPAVPAVPAVPVAKSCYYMFAYVAIFCNILEPVPVVPVVPVCPCPAVPAVPAARMHQRRLQKRLNVEAYCQHHSGCLWCLKRLCQWFQLIFLSKSLSLRLEWTYSGRFLSHHRLCQHLAVSDRYLWCLWCPCCRYRLYQRLLSDRFRGHCQSHL